MKEAWNPVMAIDPEYLSMEVNPHFANIVSPSEVVVVSTFHIELEGGGGDMHLTMPYSMIEPIREVLDAGVQSDRVDTDERWMLSLQEEILLAELEITSTLVETELTMRDINALRAGDIIPIDLPATVTARIEDIPVFRGVFGVANGKNAIKVTELVRDENHKQLVPVAGGKP